MEEVVSEASEDHCGQADVEVAGGDGEFENAGEAVTDQIDHVDDGVEGGGGFGDGGE